MTATQEEIMAESGYVTATRAAEAIGIARPGSVTRMVQRGRLRGSKAGSHWYVSVKSLLEAYADAAPICERIRALGVEPKEEVAPRRKRGKASSL